MFKQLSKIIDLTEIKQASILSKKVKALKKKRDQQLENIIKGVDKRMLLLVGPCSAHDEEAVMEYVKRLAKLQEKVVDKVFVIPRIYTNKPRSNGSGYKGLLHQPDLSFGSNFLNGILAVRRLHKQVITKTGLTTADEMLYPENLAIVDDLASYIVIGARSVENQQHRFVASGIDQPTGFKNPTSGNLTIMFNALYAAQQKQEFLFNAQHVKSSSNPLAHVILRGSLNEYGENRPNYYYEDLLKAISMYEKGNLKNPMIVIDTNHDNSGKQYLEQIRIVKQTLLNRHWKKKVAQFVRGFMIESFLEDGNQDFDGKVFGQSITDPCLGWDKTERLVNYIYENM
ncbi:MAG: 3-deoxy-7-phosphoheptulonate synthase [Streptococcaceae bacterium]|jgi:3-deoxy-7-phosphoheptulonate synthase|nr:3-deoxy-7-phosphoheptulonate synthase [Streptococcaceae bacterium]